MVRLSSSQRQFALSSRKAACASVFACLLLACGLTAQTSKSNSSEPDEFQKHFDAARRLQTSGDPEGAAREYRAFLGEALRRVADLRARSGEYETAEKLFAAGLQAAPEDGELLLDFGAMRLEQGKLSEAKALAEKSLLIDAKNARAQYLMGNVLCQLGDFQAAKEHLEAAVVGAPNFETGYLLGLTYLKLNDSAHAQLLFSDMVKGLRDTPELRMRIARAYREAGLLAPAVEELKKATALDSSAPQVHYFLGLAYLGRDGDSGFDLAAPEFRAELKRNPNDYRSHYMLGYILFKQHRLAEAETELTRAAALDPKNPDPLIYLGQLYDESNRSNEAEQTLRKAISLTEDESRNGYQISRAHYQLGRILLKKGQKSEAQAELGKSEDLRKQALQLARERTGTDAPNLAEDRPTVRGSVSVLTTEEQKKVKAYIDAMAPSIADAYNNLGVIAAESKNFAAAMDYFRRAGEWQPALATLNRNLGMAAFYANQFEQAVEPLSRHVAIQADDMRARAALALSLFALQRYDKVRATLKPMEGEANTDPGLAYAYAVSLVKTGDYERGISRLQGLATANPNSAEIHTLLGEAYADQSEWATAIEQYRKALTLDPNQAHTHFLAGLALIRQGNPGEAAQEMRMALRLDPKNVSSKYHLAFALIQTGEKTEAESLLRQVLQQDPQHAEAYYQLGKMQFEQGDMKAAISNLENGVKFNPDGDYIHYQLALAYRRDSRAEDAEREMKAYQTLKRRVRNRSSPQ